MTLWLPWINLTALLISWLHLLQKSHGDSAPRGSQVCLLQTPRTFHTPILPSIHEQTGPGEGTKLVTSRSLLCSHASIQAAIIPSLDLCSGLLTGPSASTFATFSPFPASKQVQGAGIFPPGGWKSPCVMCLSSAPGCSHSYCQETAGQRAAGGSLPADFLGI